MKRALLILFFMMLFTVPCLGAYEVDTAELTADVSATGQTQVTASFTITFSAPESRLSIPIPQENATRISVSGYSFSLQDPENQSRMVVLSPDAGFLGTQTFQVQYTVPREDEENDYADPYSLGLLSSQWGVPVGEFRFTVHMPAVPEGEPVVRAGYSGVLSPEDMELNMAGTSFSGVVRDLQGWDSLTMEMDLPNGFFQSRRATLPMISLTVWSVGMLAAALLLLIYWQLRLRNPRTASAQRIMLPEGVLTCQLPLALDGVTVDVAAMILEWGNLGYLSISRGRMGSVVLIRQMQMGSERSRAERQLFNRIFNRRRVVACTPGRFSAAAEQFRAASRKSLRRVIFDRKGGNPVLVQVPARLLLALAVGILGARLLPDGAGFVVLSVLIGLVGLVYSLYLHSALTELTARRIFTRSTLICLVLIPVLLGLGLFAGALPEMVVGLAACVFSGIATAVGPRRSRRGLEILSQAKGCRSFFRHASWQRLQLCLDRNDRFFQDQLPRAVALQSERQFADRFERLAVPMPEWLELSESAIRSASAVRMQLSPVLRHLRECFR